MNRGANRTGNCRNLREIGAPIRLHFYWHQKHYSWLRRAESELRSSFSAISTRRITQLKNKRTEKRWFPSHQVYTKKQKSISKRDSQALWTREWEPDGVIGTWRLQRQIESLSMDTLGFPISRSQTNSHVPIRCFNNYTKIYFFPRVFLITRFYLFDEFILADRKHELDKWFDQMLMRKSSNVFS